MKKINSNIFLFSLFFLDYSDRCIIFVALSCWNCTLGFAMQFITRLRETF